ncbi:LOW QUALITY PROTEIN: coiled-coil domain-containing protein 63 [Tyto alba]|uniref:LOW QUALITY PROTEIN: coiled-coil domain-containing protein 63 n=1 Tax=Tyto alba TaxID=56313 RepID=UPI001C668DAA|nr:LOW QUALITY PROTEIN: coiled-coil domain-containing protein 63 [Tyto alba]
MGRSQQGGSSLRQNVSDFPVKENEKLAEAEIRRLQKQFRIAAEKRKSYGANMKRQMQAQEKEIELLTEEHKKESLTLSQLTSLRNAMLDDRICMEFQCLLQTKYQYDSLIRDRKALLADLDNQILVLEKKVVRQNQIAAKVKQANSSKRLQKQVETLEVHLNNVTVHFNTILTRNNKLREEIENLRIQKAILDNFYLKLHKKLAQQRRRMNTAIEQSAQGYEQRMEALARISAMSERHSKDTVQYSVELQEREHLLAQEAKLKTFMLAKFTDHSELEEQAKKRKALKAAQRAKRSQGESFESREVAYKCLLELAEDGDIDRLVNGFTEREEKNFDSFSYAIKLNNEMEKIQWRIKDLQNEIMALTAGQEYAESSSLHILQELEEKLMKTTEEANEYEDRCKKSSKVLGQLKSDMEDLFRKINCDATEIMKQLGENRRITDLNLMQFFGLVEKKTNELLVLESILRYTSADGSLLGKPFANPLLGSVELLQAMDRAQLCPQPPALDSISDTIDALEVPLDHNQLCQLIVQNQEKEQGNATSTGKKERNGIKV